MPTYEFVWVQCGEVFVRVMSISEYKSATPPCPKCGGEAKQQMSSFIVILTFFSALSTFVLPRAARSQLNRIVFGLTRRVFEFILHFVKSYERRDAIMAYYAPISVMLLVPTWYALISLGFTAMYWALGGGDWLASFRLSDFYLERLPAQIEFPIALLIQLALPSEIPGYLFGTLRVPFRTYVAVLALVEAPYAIGTVLLGESILRRDSIWMLVLAVMGILVSLLAVYLLHRKLGHTPDHPPP